MNGAGDIAEASGSDAIYQMGHDRGPTDCVDITSNLKSNKGTLNLYLYLHRQ